jgi:hypothetical protein
MTATGTAPLRYQWKKITATATNNVSGATSNSLTFESLTLADTGSYYVVVTNVFGSAASTVAVLTVVNGPYVTSLTVSPTTVLRGEALSLKATAAGGNLVWQWVFNATNVLTDGGAISGSATSNLVIFPADTVDSGTYTVVATNSVGSTNKSVAVAVLADTHSPSVAVSSPAAGVRTNAVTFTGTASEAVSGVYVQITNVAYWITNLNGSPLTNGTAQLTSGTVSASNWTVAITPYPGTNIFMVQSRDFSGRTSSVVSLKFFMKSEAPLTVITNTGSGSGSAKVSAVTGQDALPTNGPGLQLYVGESYTITAKQDPYSYFVDWTVTGLTNSGPMTNTTLDFIMESNAVITAHFTTNIFLGMAGTYNGLFSSEALGVTEETAGMISALKLETNGSYSGTFRLNGSASGISGNFTPLGQATNTQLKSVTVEMTVTNSDPRTITGAVIGTNILLSNGVPVMGWVSGLDLFASMTNTLSDAGAYTLLVPPSAANMPPGYGYALLTNNPGTATVPASVTIVGALADEGPISQNVPIGEDNGVPIYQNPYSNGVSGLLWGRLSLTGANAPSGSLTWIRKAGGGEFDAGFTNTALSVLGSYWSNAFLPVPQLTQLVVSNGGLTAALTNEVVLNTTNLVIGTNGFKSASYNPNNGKLTITFTNGGKAVTGYGALLQDGLDGTLGGGFFILGPTNAPTNAGTILLQPQPQPVLPDER